MLLENINSEKNVHHEQKASPLKGKFDKNSALKSL